MGPFDRTDPNRPFTVIQGTFSGLGDGLKERKEICRSDRYTIELAWRDFYEPIQLHTPVAGPRNAFGMTSLFIPAKMAEVIINGKQVSGNVYPQMRSCEDPHRAALCFWRSRSRGLGRRGECLRARPSPKDAVSAFLKVKPPKKDVS